VIGINDFLPCPGCGNFPVVDYFEDDNETYAQALCNTKACPSGNMATDELTIFKMVVDAWNYMCFSKKNHSKK